jgi:enamine deaminase RidA (YjgF/YER057c/UK114 family)
VAGDGIRSPPSAWRVAAAILPLPFVATVLVPAAVLGSWGINDWGLGGLARAATILLGAALAAAGLALFAWTVRLFASVGRGTLAPWDPPERLVVAGPYRRFRHPMITGVALVLAGEALAFASTGIAIVLAAFVAINALYLPLVEEPALRRRFGSDYQRYIAHVPRWLPRLRPWEPNGALSARERGHTQVVGARRTNPSELYVNVPYEYASVAPAGGLVFTAGACPLDASGATVAPGDFEAQTRQTLDNLELALRAAGSSLDDVLKTTVYVVAEERAQLIQVFDLVEAHFGPARPPSTLLGVSFLGYPDQLVEIEAIARRSERQ